MGGIDWGKVRRDMGEPERGKSGSGRSDQAMALIENADASLAAYRSSLVAYQMGFTSNLLLMDMLVKSGALPIEKARSTVLESFDALVEYIRGDYKSSMESLEDEKNGKSGWRNFLDIPKEGQELFARSLEEGTISYFEDWLENLSKLREKLVAELNSSEDSINTDAVREIISEADHVKRGLNKGIARAMVHALDERYGQASRIDAAKNRNITATYKPARTSTNTQVESADLNVVATYGPNGKAVTESNMFPCHVQVEAKVDDEELKSFLDSWQSDGGIN